MNSEGTKITKGEAIRHPDQRVGVFIDIQNMYYSAKGLFNSKVNFGNIVRHAVGSRRLVRAIAYVVSTETKEEQPFFSALYNSGIEIKERPLQVFFGGAKKADWDVGITIDAVRISESLDVVILVSGDGDYIPLVEYLQNQGKQVEVLAFRETTSSKLIEAADGFTDLSASKKDYLIFDRHGHLPTYKRMGIGSATTGATSNGNGIQGNAKVLGNVSGAIISSGPQGTREQKTMPPARGPRKARVTGVN